MYYTLLTGAPAQTPTARLPGGKPTPDDRHGRSAAPEASLGGQAAVLTISIN